MSAYGRTGIYFLPQNIAGRISKAATGGTGGREPHSLCGPVERKKSLTWAAQVG